MKKRNLFIGSAIVAVGLIAIPTAANAASSGSWLLGRSNSESAETKVTSSAGTPLNLVAKTGYAPLKVNSSKTVTNLSADKLDGLSSGSFLRSTGKAADADKVDGVHASSFARTSAKSGVVTHAGYDDYRGAVCPAGTVVTGGGGYDEYGWEIGYSGPDWSTETGAVIPNSWLVLDVDFGPMVSFANCVNLTGVSGPRCHDQRQQCRHRRDGLDLLGPVGG